MDTTTRNGTSHAPRTTTLTDTVPTRRSTPTLGRLLDDELAYGTDARDGFISHAAMGLIAAARLGADDATLKRWFQAELDDRYLVRRPERPAWLAERLVRVDENGIEAEVRSTVGDLVDRTGGFFHWMIRLELAIDIGHPGQVANALGDWQLRPRRSPGEVPVPTGSRAVSDVLHELWSSDERRGGPSEAPGTTGLARWVADEVADAPDLLGETAAAVADLYWEAGDFVTLHMVTGTRAARALVPFLDETDRRRLALAHLHAVASVAPRVPRPGRGPGPVPDPTTLPDWSEIGAAAIETRDDHVVKLTYAARLEEEATGRPIYRAIAARAAGLSSSSDDPHR
jgi:hypothetical protein